MVTFAAWYPAEQCTDGPEPGAKALMALILENFEQARNLGIYNCRTVRGGTTTSPHGEGRALDVGFPLDSDGTGSKYGYALVNALLAADPVRLGIQAIIYDRKIWSAKSPAGRAYTGTHPHYDHVHFEITRSAAASITLATVRAVLGGAAPTPEPTPESRYESYKRGAKPGSRTVRRWSAGDDVAELQRVLNAWYPRLSRLAVDGYFGAKTADRVRYMQQKANLTVDGVVGKNTWARLLGGGAAERKPLAGKVIDLSNLIRAARTAGRDGGDYSVEGVQVALNHEFGGTDLKVDGIFGKATRDRYAAWQRRLGYSGSDANGIPGSTSARALAVKYGARIKA
jgi:peptidoglycan hydrolase-like protein with peptidoglycan-binding domain